ncbi:MAG: peptidase [Gammaproteobacteria bacterium]|nr:MAG: peptidase [Gammaproteobacteria bacterium]
MNKPAFFLLITILLLVTRTEFANSLELQGSFTQGGMLIGKTEPGNQVLLDGTAIAVSDRGQFVFGFGRDAKLSHLLDIVKPNGTKTRKTIEIEKRKYNIQRIDGIPRKMMQPSKQALKRAGTEARLVKKARNIFSTRTDFLGGFVVPVKGRITGVYGSQRIFNGEPRRPHFGIDYAAPLGTAVKAPASGVVSLVHNDMFYSGGTLIIDHGMGVSSTFIHLQKILVKPGEAIKQGDKIALVGTTGRSTGPHLDWRVNWFQVRLDPALLVTK